MSLRENKLEHVPDYIKNLDSLNVLEIEYEYILIHKHAQIINHNIGIKAENGRIIGLGLNDSGLREVNEEIGNLKTLKF